MPLWRRFEADYDSTLDFLRGPPRRGDRGGGPFLAVTFGGDGQRPLGGVGGFGVWPGRL